ncbi:Enoyl-CoA hydratase branched-chain amino acid degradation [Paramagnetospirillum magnetotacticum MS-1]|uniref:Enoyl-CoA hydratase branched-chain amino acid degradation n=1 Tax=Paramagnetospirillum magnetotacticum MS-1 TaxID=272627 RepID=A0A0C2YH38_PARME|nr:enoyl-CoA hydratase [Paramagnetospirillum magnetotacticum]KIL99034.1 Enoyl-CoA hydratase branched-chain amino acid degradation [Paramagnetospirillum magnetotacticum MS-1]
MTEVLLEKPFDSVVLLRINRPEAKNALNGEVRRQLAEHMTALGADPSVRAIVMTGNQEAFAAGADIKDMAEVGAIELMQRNNHLLWRAIANCPKPVIAAVNGYAWGGGCELVMHADIIVAGENASFSQPEVKVGIMPGAGGTQRLTRAVGKFKAMLMVMTGQAISGVEAGQMGLASLVVPDEQVLDKALEIAKTISRMPPVAIAQIKEVLLAGQDASLDTALMLERKAFQLLFASRDQKEGMKAFIEKRKPAYEGK